jgi:hypothetical protein
MQKMTIYKYKQFAKNHIGFVGVRLLNYSLSLHFIAGRNCVRSEDRNRSKRIPTLLTSIVQKRTSRLQASDKYFPSQNEFLFLSLSLSGHLDTYIFWFAFQVGHWGELVGVQREEGRRAQDTCSSVPVYGLTSIYS